MTEAVNYQEAARKAYAEHSQGLLEARMAMHKLPAAVNDKMLAFKLKLDADVKGVHDFGSYYDFMQFIIATSNDIRDDILAVAHGTYVG